MRHVLHLPVGAGEPGLAQVAGAQRGVVSRAQLLALGFGRRAIARRVARGALHRLFRGVFAVGHPSLAPLAPETAALLYAGDECVLSHGTAAVLWGLGRPAAELSITIGRHIRGQTGLVLHRTHALDSRDVRLRDGLPVTAPARTLIDLAATASGDALQRALNEARVLALVTDREIEAAIARVPRRPGTRPLRALLAVQRGPAITRSAAERVLRGLLERAELRPTRLNCFVHGWEVDALWAPERLVIEVDGYGTHGHRAAFERDRRKDQQLIAVGYTVIRVTWRQLVDEPLAVVARIAQGLARAEVQGEHRAEPEG